jgi:Abnormal spindle-like microcephaly-assoc'd, ASPM-SPD-2-Hydin
VTVDPASLTFTALAVGSSSAAQTVTLTNTGQVAVAVTSIAATGDFSETNTCGSSVAVGANCTISVVFTPTDSGARSGTVTITDNAGGSPQTVALTGTGTSVALAPTASTLSIGGPGGTATDAITISSAQGFSGTVNLTCAVNFQGTGTATDPPTCTVTPASGQVTADTPLTAMLSVSTTASGSTSPSAAIDLPQNPVHGGSGRALLPASISFAALLFAGFLPRRRWREMGFVILLALGCTLTVIGCGGGSKSTSSNTGTTAGTYQVVVTATSGALTASSTITLTVQ